MNEMMVHFKSLGRKRKTKYWQKALRLQEDRYYNARPNMQRSWHERGAVTVHRACYSKRDYRMERKSDVTV